MDRKKIIRKQIVTKIKLMNGFMNVPKQCRCIRNNIATVHKQIVAKIFFGGSFT